MNFPVEILSVGEWNGRDYTRPELEQLVTNFYRLRERVKPPLKRGHDDSSRDGDPAIGWVTGLRLAGDKLVADVDVVAPAMQRAIEQRLYRRVSSEIAVGVKLGDQPIGLVLTGLALLGADLPAVDNLADLQTYLGAPEAVVNALAQAQRLTLTYQPEE